MVAKAAKFTDPNGKAYPQIQYIFKLYFKLNYSEKKKINLLSNNKRAVDSNEKNKTIGTKPVCYFLKEQVMLMEKIA